MASDREGPASAGQAEVELSTPASRAGLGAAVAVAAGLASLPWWAEPSTLHLIVEAVCLLVLAQMWNLLGGYGGLVSVGQQAYVGLGGYALVALADHAGLDPFLCVPLGGAVAALAAIPVSRVAFRLQGGYFAIGTWVIAEVFRLSIANTRWLGGGSGQSLISMRAYPRSLREAVTYWIALAVLVAAVLSMYLLLRSRFGLGLTAMRDSEVAAESQGIDVAATKLWVYGVAAFGGGVAGALYFLMNLRISPDAAFGVNWSAVPIFIVLIGGIGTIEGPIVGTALFFALRELLVDHGAWHLIVIGLCAVVITIAYPRGLWGEVSRRFDVSFFPVQRRVRWPTGPSEPAGPDTPAAHPRRG
jgi:branched-chain amino acid transport system permease protein